MDTNGSGRSSLMYKTFHLERELGEGGMGKIFKVRADRAGPGFKSFLAGAIAWQEVVQNRVIQKFRKEIIQRNRAIAQLIEQESTLMDNGKDKAAHEVRDDIEQMQEALSERVGILKQKQDHFIKKRATEFDDTPAKAMIWHLEKMGIPYPRDNIFVIKKLLVRDKTYRIRLYDEFKSLKLLSHENIPIVYTCGKDYYVMEFIHDMVRPKYIKADPSAEKGEYTNRERINIIIQAAKAIEHSHLFGIIHRDITPNNIAVDKSGNVKVIDFGLVKSLETENITQTGATMGTPHYMCPEQISSAKKASPTFDIYALGGTLYYYLTGEHPYSRAQHKHTGKIKQQKSAQSVFLTAGNPVFEPLPPTKIADGIPIVLEDIILNRDFPFQPLKWI